MDIPVVELSTFVSATSLYASPLVSSLPPSRGIAIPRAVSTGKRFSHAFACELMRGVVTQLDAEGTSHEYHRSGSCAALLWAGDFVVRLRFPLGKTLGILSSRSAWESGSCIAAGVPRRTPRPPRQLSEEPPKMLFGVAVLLAVTAAVGGILKEELESTTTSLCRTLQPASQISNQLTLNFA